MNRISNFRKVWVALAASVILTGCGGSSNKLASECATLKAHAQAQAQSIVNPITGLTAAQASAYRQQLAQDAYKASVLQRHLNCPG